SLALELSREVVEGGARLRLLLPRQIDPARRQERARFRRNLKRLCRFALRRQLEDPRSVGIGPELRHEATVEVLRRRLQLEDKDWPEYHQLVESDAVGTVVRKQRALLLREELRERTPAERRLTHRA